MELEMSEMDCLCLALKNLSKFDPMYLVLALF